GHVHDWAGAVSGSGVRVVRWQLLRLLVGRWVLRDDGLYQLRAVSGRRDELEHALFGGREQDVETLDLRVPAIRFELRHEPLRVVVVVRRADMMRARGQPLHRASMSLRIGDRAELRLPVALGAS